MVTRNPDLFNGAFREYGVKWRIPRVARLFGISAFRSVSR
jgi:hypothetical protein